MIAPRKKLWSTPLEVIDCAIELLDLQNDDVVYDLGAGDGRFLMRCIEKSTANCVGVEIEYERFKEAVSEIEKQGISPHRCKMLHANALEVDFSKASAFFLYLVPRGLRIIFPLILKSVEENNRTVKIVTYMSPLPDISPFQIVKVSTLSHPEAEWPLYFYVLKGSQN